MALFSDDKKVQQQMTEAIIQGVADTVARAISESLAPVFTVFAANVKKSLDSANERQSDSVNQMTRAFMETLETETKGTFGDMNAAALENARLQRESIEKEAELVDSIKDAVAAMKETSEAQGAVLQEMRAATAGLNECITKAAEEMRTAVNEASSGMKDVTVGISDKMKGITSETTEELKGIYASISDSLKNISEGQAGNLEELTAVLKHLDDHTREQKEILENHQTTWAENYVKADEEINKSSEALLSQMSRSAKSMTTYTTALNEVADSMKIQLPSFEENLTKTINDIFEVLDKQLAEVAETLGKTAEEVNSAAERLPKALRGIV